MEAVTDEETETEEQAEPDTSAPVEPEPDEEEAETGDEPEPVEEPAEPAGLSEAELEKMSKKLDGEATRHANRLSEIMGDAAQALVPCELCDQQTAGFHLPVEILQPESDLDERLISALRSAGEPKYKQASTARECQDCGGYGKVLSGSRVPGQERVQCPACGGRGFIGVGFAAGNGHDPVNVVELIQPADEQPLVGGEKDIWDSPRLLPDGQENPNYGKMPQYKNPTLP